MQNEKNLSRSKALSAKLIHAALSILRENGNEMPVRSLYSEIEKKVALEEWAREKYHTGMEHWKVKLSFYSSACVKALYLIKKKGIWYLTPEGEEALKLSPQELIEEIEVKYKDWAAGRTQASGFENTEDAIPFDLIEQQALDGLKQFIASKNPYEFQDLVAALLRGMGYYTVFVAPKGKDGGIDVIAYSDPLGIETPRIKVQVKHRESGASVQEIRQLMGLLQKDGDIGIFVSTAGFTPDCRQTARASHIHIELIDLDRFIQLWQNSYERLSEEDKGRMPLQPIYFLAPTALNQ